MVTEDEIQHVAKLMRIEADDYAEYVDKVHSMIQYFDILDAADVGDEDIPAHDTPVSCLRDDEHVPFDGDLIKHLKQYRGGYVRAPRMS